MKQLVLATQMSNERPIGDPDMDDFPKERDDDEYPDEDDNEPEDFD